MVRSPVTGAVNIAVTSAAVHALAEQFDELGLHEAASGWEHEGSENWSTNGCKWIRCCSAWRACVRV